MNVSFNKHDWNHAPYLSLNISLIDPSVTNNGKAQINISISSLLTNEPIDACVSETLYTQIPAEEGHFIFRKGISTNEEITAKFYSMDCDAGKDSYILDDSMSNWIDVRDYDAASRVVEATFNLSFVIDKRNSDFGPIYPKHINLKGTVKAKARILK